MAKIENPLMLPFFDEVDEVSSPETLRHSYFVVGGIFLALLLLVSAGLTLGGEVGSFVGVGLQYLPFIPLLLLGAIGMRHSWARMVGYLYAFMLQGSILLFTMLFAGLGLMASSGSVYEVVTPRMIFLFGLLLLLLALSSLVLLPEVRERLAPWLPLDAKNFTHTLALWLVLFITFSAYAQLVFLQGQPPLLTAIAKGLISEAELNKRSALGQSLDLIYGLVWMIPLGLLGAGWPLRRRLGPALQRLGLVRPTQKQVLFALGAALFLVLTMLLAGEGISWLWRGLGWQETDTKTFEQLLKGIFNPLGALVIGVTAGLGEELAVRGLLQPRLGLLLSNLAFTAVHAYQYGGDALLSVFFLGMLLGIIRLHTNTTTCAIIHGVYDALLVLGSLFQP